jgi:hypothetical protein
MVNYRLAIKNSKLLTLNSNGLLKKLIRTHYVMLNLVLNLFQYRFSISIKLLNYETLNRVQGDR